jgi:hypothetical protein
MQLRYSGADGRRVSRQGYHVAIREDFSTLLDATEAVDRLQMHFTELRVAHAQTFLRSQAEHTDLALVDIAVHVVSGLPGLV